MERTSVRARVTCPCRTDMRRAVPAGKGSGSTRLMSGESCREQRRAYARAATRYWTSSGARPTLLFMEVALRRLRSQAARHTLVSTGHLKEALSLLPFVQVDPIRAPARAQDLILRQRVAGYRIGDLERAYPELDLEEGFLYAYGFLPRLIWQVRHPANTSRMTALEKKILARVGELGVVHPEALRAELGTRSAVNGWGGQSTRVKLALESLHARGLLRVAQRRAGIRMYAPCPPLRELPPPAEVFRLVALTVVRVLAPAPERTVRSIMARLSRRIPGVASPVKELAALVTRGVLVRELVSGLQYLSLPDDASVAAPEPDGGRRVRFLAPFDPLVWDRLRFEQLWGWSYRFEAYTPADKRVRGYYAMPLAFGDDVIGWANIAAKAGQMDVELGFVGSRPKSREFKLALDDEVERMRSFLTAASGDAQEDEPAPDGLSPVLARPERTSPLRRGRPKASAPLDGAIRATEAPESSRPRANRRSPQRRS
jgi:uncharacterized protein